MTFSGRRGLIFSVNIPVDMNIPNPRSDARLNYTKAGVEENPVQNGALTTSTAEKPLTKILRLYIFLWKIGHISQTSVEEGSVPMKMVCSLLLAAGPILLSEMAPSLFADF